MTTPSQLLFLPGASGNTQFWQPVAQRLAFQAKPVHLGWPGFGPTPRDPRVQGFDDLVGMVVAHIDQPTALIAQSMGGVVALRAALQRPGQVTHLVLAATSGGMDISDLAPADWRGAFQAANPSFPRWFSDHAEDLSPRLKEVCMPVLLLWGDDDPISPVGVGRRLAQRLPHASLHVVAGGTHDLANTLASQVAPLIDAHLRGPADGG